MKRFLPLLALLLGLFYLGSALRPARNKTEFDVAGFARLPVLLNGRIKPLDTVARTTLLTFQRRQSVRSPVATWRVTPQEWLLDAVFRPDVADTYPTFEIQRDNPDVLALIGKTPESVRIRYDSAVKNALALFDFLPKRFTRFSYAEIAPFLPEIDKQAKLADSTEPKSRTPFQHSLLALRENLSVYQRLKHSFVLPDSPNFLAELQRLGETRTQSIEAITSQRDGKPYDEAAFRATIASLSRYQSYADFTYVRPVPSTDPANPTAWRSIGQALLEEYRNGGVSIEVMTFAALGQAWKEQRPAQFNEGIRLYRAALEKNFGPFLKKTDLETRFNAAEPFYKSLNLYIMAFLLAIISWLAWPQTLAKSAFYLTALAFTASTAGLIVRIWLSGYAPVTNLYSSALFVGWVATGLCLILEKIYKNGIGSVAAGMIGFGTLIIAHHLSLDGDKLEMMRAVLDSNLWLSTHVVTVTAGYGATFLAGALAIIYIFRGLVTRSLDKASADSLSRMVYGIVCFATFFSLVGTVLGGIWADQSWGRFWGWDPKENGALIIVIWNAIILHARWGGLLKQRGLMTLAVFGNIVTSWSWFGTNLLEVGLHSYGFTSSGAFVLTLFVLSQLLIIALAQIPLEKWRSFSAKPA